MKYCKWIVALMFMLLLTCAGFASAERIDSGTCGNSESNVRWYLDSNGTLTISGTGDMAVYSIANDVPWYAYRKMIHIVMIGDGVESVGNYAFLSCDNLSNVTIGSSVKSIGLDAFEYCSKLTEVRIPDSVTVIDQQAFYYCSNLKCVYIGNGVTNIKFRAFGGCARLERVYLGKSVTNIQAYAFNYCTALTDVYYNGTEAGMKAITIYGENMTLQNATWHCGARGTCGDDLSWELDNGTLTISGTGAMKDYSYPDDLPYWVEYLASDVRTVVIEQGVTKLGNNAFVGCSNLSSVSIPDTVTIIADNVFTDCAALTSVSIPDSVATIGYQAFSNTGLTEVVVPGSVTRLLSYAFGYCASLEKVTIMEGVSRIGNSFGYCSNLKSVTIPASVTTIVGRAFSGCSALAIVYYDGTAENRAAITIAENGNDALLKAHWHYLRDGKTLRLPDTLVQIGSEAFAGISAEVIVIPANCQSIAFDAFDGCPNLRLIINHSNVIITPPSGVAVIED